MPSHTPHADKDNNSVKELIHKSAADNDVAYTKFIVYIKNARIQNKDRIAELLLELRDVDWDIVMFSETRLKSGTQELEDAERNASGKKPKHKLFFQRAERSGHWCSHSRA